MATTAVDSDWQDIPAPQSSASSGDWQDIPAPTEQSTSLLSKIKQGASNALNLYNRSQFGSPQDLLSRLDSTVRGRFNKVGQFAAENLGQNSMNPNVAAGVGTFIQMAPDLASLSGPEEETNLGQGTMNKVYKKVVPPILKPTKGIPPEASRMAIDNPGIFDLPGNSGSIQGKAQDIINAVKEASGKVGQEYNAAYTNAGMESPVEAIKAGRYNKYVGRSLDELRPSYQAAKSGDLFTVPDQAPDAIGSGGTTREMSPNEKLSELTDLKRGLKAQADYLASGQQLGPTDSAGSTAIKQMASEIDRIRGGVPGGDSLALADDAYSEMQAIKQRLISSFKDEATGQDYLNRILKGNMDWLTSGRNAAKVGAIQRVEQITGRQILKPALEEMAAAYLKNPDTMGLPSTKIQDIIGHFVPTKRLLTPPKMASRALLGVGNFAAGQAAKPLFASGKNNNGQAENIQSAYQKPAQTANNQGNQYGGQNNDNGDLGGQPNQGKILDESTARQFISKAKQVGAKSWSDIKEMAREMARTAGYLIQ